MKRVLSGAFAVLACAAVVSLSAQTPPPPSEQQPSAAAKQPSADPANKVTVTGCLERAKESAAPTGTTGAAASAEATKFVLNNVTAAPSASGTAGTSGSAPIASSYRLDATDAKLTAHVGHKVTISGTVEKQASATGAAMSASAPKLKVDTVTHVSPTCTP